MFEITYGILVWKTHFEDMCIKIDMFSNVNIKNNILNTPIEYSFRIFI